MGMEWWHPPIGKFFGRKWNESHSSPLPSSLLFGSPQKWVEHKEIESTLSALLTKLPLYNL